jgi:hypothetical protein
MIAGHPHTVRTSPIPIYMRGLGAIEWHLGDDSGILFSDVQTPIDTTMYDPSGDLIPPSFATDYGTPFLPSIPAVTPIDPSMYDPTGGLVAPVSNLSPQDQALATLYKNSVAAGTLTPAQGASAIAQLMNAGAATAKAAQGLTTAPSPRVTVPAVPGAANVLTQSTVIPGVPNFVLLAAAAVAAFAMGSK